MPLQLVDYDKILGNPKKTRLPVGRKQYNEYWASIVSILQKNAQSAGIYECEIMSDLRKMWRLLWNRYELITLDKWRDFPNIQLKQIITARRATCILDWTYRYIAVRDKRLP